MYQLKYHKDVIKKDIPALSKPISVRIKKAIEDKLIADPIIFGKPLTSNLKGHYRIRVGNYRVVYKVDGNVVWVTAIKHRKNVY